MKLEQMQTMRDKMQQMKKEYEEVIQKFGKEIFNSATKELFENNPKLTSFAWVQYTPYFNDGDTCTFRVNRDCLTINRSDEFLDWWGMDRWKDPEYEYTPDPKDYECDSVDELISIVKGISEFLDLFEDDDLEMLFGDHAEITIFRDGQIGIDSYDHD